MMVWGTAATTTFAGSTAYPTITQVTPFPYQAALAIRALLLQVSIKHSLIRKNVKARKLDVQTNLLNASLTVVRGKYRAERKQNGNGR